MVWMALGGLLAATAVRVHGRGAVALAAGYGRSHGVWRRRRSPYEDHHQDEGKKAYRQPPPSVFRLTGVSHFILLNRKPKLMKTFNG
jgi:hypothetical protein